MDFASNGNRHCKYPAPGMRCATRTRALKLLIFHYILCWRYWRFRLNVITMTHQLSVQTFFGNNDLFFRLKRHSVSSLRFSSFSCCCLCVVASYGPVAAFPNLVTSFKAFRTLSSFLISISNGLDTPTGHSLPAVFLPYPIVHIRFYTGNNFSELPLALRQKSLCLFLNQWIQSGHSVCLDQTFSSTHLSVSF